MEERYSQKGLIHAVKENRLYDYIANHYTEMSQYDLKEVMLALIGVCYDKCYDDVDEHELCNSILVELEEREFREE